MGNIRRHSRNMFAFRRVTAWVVTGMLLSGVAAPLRGEDPEPLAIGQEAPGFNLKGTDGHYYSLENFRDAEVLAIVFTANHCPTAQAYEERIRELAEAYPPEKMRLVAISSNYPGAVCLEELGYTDLGDTFEEMIIRAEEKAYNYPYLYDGETQEVALAYGALATPHVFIFDRDRKLRYRGRIDDVEDPYRTPASHDARNAIDALLKGEPVPVETTKAFGCSMKWKSKVAWRDQLDREWNERPVLLEGIDGEGIRALVENRGSNLRLINVWATWCGPCVIEFPEFVKMQRMYGQRNFEVVSLSTDQPAHKEKVLQFLDEKEASFTNYIYASDDPYSLIEWVDPGWQGNLPYTMLVAPGGKVLYRHSGIIDPLEVRQAVIAQIGRYFADDL